MGPLGERQWAYVAKGIWGQALSYLSFRRNKAHASIVYRVMPRKERVCFPGAVFHTGSRGVEKRKIFLDAKDCTTFGKIMEEVISAAGALRLAHCLMKNHFHLAIKVAEVPLSAIMQRLLGRYAMYFNRRHDRTGHLFQGRYWDELCKDNAQLATLIPYIHMNPVRAGFVSDPADWPWSSFHEWRLSGKNPLISTMADLPNLELAARVTPNLLRASESESPITLHELAIGISKSTGISVDELMSGSRRRATAAARRELMRAAVFRGMMPSAVARELHIHPSLVTIALRETTKP